MGLITRYELVEILPIGDWISIIAMLQTAFVQNPDDLASLPRLGAISICDAFLRMGGRSLYYGKFASVGA